MQTLSLHHLTVLEASPPELVSIAAELGIGQVGIFVENPPQSSYPLVTPGMVEREMASRLADTGVTPHVIEVFCLGHDIDQTGFEQALDLGARLGGTRAATIMFEPDPLRAQDLLARFADLVASFGITSSVEFMAFSTTNSLEAALDLVRRAGKPNVQVTVDALHLNRTGGTNAALAAAERHLIGYAQICDGPAEMPVERQFDEAVTERMIPGAGTFALQAFVDALPPTITIDVEVPLKAMTDNGIGAFERARRTTQAAQQFLAARTA